MILRLAHAIIRMYCLDCHQPIWFWQPRCGHAHTTCRHEDILRLWRQNQDMILTIPLAVWPCTDCGLVPA